MSSEERLARIQGIKALIHDAVDFTVDRVEDGHDSAARGAARIVDFISPELAPLVEGIRALASIPLSSVRAVNRALERYTAALVPWIESPAQIIPMRSDIMHTPAWLSDATLGVLNGAAGDHLARTKNPIDLGFQLRHGDRYLADDEPAPAIAAAKKIAVFVHGLGTTEWSWCWEAADYHRDPAASFGTLLERDLGFTPIYARYNTGRHISENGAFLADRLEQLFDTELEELILIGHSLGGLVVQSACHHARKKGHRWLARLTKVFSLGTPHQGAPLAKLGNILEMVLGVVDHPGAQVPSEILRRRSAGIRDLQRGTLPEEVALVDGVAYYFLSSTLMKDRAHPLGSLIGDVLVRVKSASGPAACDESFTIETECFGGIAHHQVQNHPDVYKWLSAAARSARDRDPEDPGSDAPECPRSDSTQSRK